jgi:hypothetical protein
MAKAANRCGACIFWDAAAEQPEHGRCRARPPAALTVTGHAAWPVTRSTDWCGEFKAPEARR